MTAHAVASSHLGLNWPASVDDEAGADDCADQSFPRIGALVGEDDDHPAVGNERAVASLERAKHSVFVGVLRCCLVAAEAARIVDQFAVLLLAIPLRTKWFAKGLVDFRRESVERSPEPDIEEIHQIGIRNRIVVGRVSYDHVNRLGRSRYCAVALDLDHVRRRLGRPLGRWRAANAHPLKRAGVATAGLAERIDFSRSPNVSAVRNRAKCLAIFSSP